MSKPVINPFISWSAGVSLTLLAYWCANGCVVMYGCACVPLYYKVCYLAVHDEVTDAAGEVFVLKLGVDVWDVLVHTAELKHLTHVQVSKTHSGTEAFKKQERMKQKTIRLCSNEKEPEPAALALNSLILISRLQFKIGNRTCYQQTKSAGSFC